MLAKDLYKRLEEDFITEDMQDVWARFMMEIEEYLSENFKERSMGVVCDFAEVINKVYTVVFPTVEVLQKIMDDNVEDAMVFLHHPSNWDIRNTKSAFYQMDKNQLEKLKERRISIYNLHVPLDNYSKYSTSNTLAEALEIKVEKPFAFHNGGLNGVIGITQYGDIEELNAKFSKVLGHETKYYLYGDSNIKDGRVAIVAGGGNDITFLKEMLEKDVRVLITGISANIERYREVHEFERKNNICVLGGTHYSTEKFACMRMCDYFKDLGLPSIFIEGEAILEDM